MIDSKIMLLLSGFCSTSASCLKGIWNQSAPALHTNCQSADQHYNQSETEWHLLHASAERPFWLLCSRASDFGLVKIDATGRITSFVEKPKGDELKAAVSFPSQIF
jgi:hypothetical protein